VAFKFLNFVYFVTLVVRLCGFSVRPRRLTFFSTGLAALFPALVSRRRAGKRNGTNPARSGERGQLTLYGCCY